jgi:hypothetical protein
MVIFDTRTLQNPAGAKFRLNVTNRKKNQETNEKNIYHMVLSHMGPYQMTKRYFHLNISNIQNNISIYVTCLSYHLGKYSTELSKKTNYYLFVSLEESLQDHYLFRLV